jgi:hypothetical protein
MGKIIAFIYRGYKYLKFRICHVILIAKTII